jgi:hypothetical protein
MSTLMTDCGHQPVAPAQDRRQDDRKITPKAREGYIRTAQDSNNETRAIGAAVIILTRSSKRFRLDGVEVFAVLKDRFVLCCLKDAVSPIT